MSSEKSLLPERLSANLLHELNNSLDGVHRYVRLLLDQIPGDDPRRIYAEHARDGLMRMANMVREMLDSTRRDTSDLTPIDIPQSITWTLCSFRHRISAQNIKVEAEFDENVPVIMNVDVEQIFTNIVKNAVQAMPNGGTLSVSVKMLSPQLLEARFSDTGSGIPDEIREMIFEPFFTTKGLEEGTGLGLSISQEIAQSYGGLIDTESRLGEGATFVVRLPVTENGLIANHVPNPNTQAGIARLWKTSEDPRLLG